MTLRDLKGHTKKKRALGCEGILHCCPIGGLNRLEHLEANLETLLRWKLVVTSCQATSSM